MSVDKNQENMVDQDIVENVELEEVSEELVDEEQVIGEETQEEILDEAKVEEEEDEEESDEDEDESDGEDDDEEEVVESPKTKAAIMASVQNMLKKATKAEAQKIYASACGYKKESVEESTVDYKEELATIVESDEALSEDFKEKTSVLFEAALKSKLSEEKERLENEYAQNLEEEVSELKSELVEKVDSYLNYVVETWMQENELQVVTGLRTEIAEDFMSSLHSVFKEHYIEVPESKIDLVDELSEQVVELEEQLNTTTEENIRLFTEAQSLERKQIIAEASSGLAATEAEKLASLVEDIDFESAESFVAKVDTIKEAYFPQEIVEQADEAQSLVGDNQFTNDVSDVMAKYTQAISHYSK